MPERNYTETAIQEVHFMDDHDIINLYWARSQDAISESDRKEDGPASSRPGYAGLLKKVQPHAGYSECLLPVTHFVCFLPVASKAFS